MKKRKSNRKHAGDMNKEGNTKSKSKTNTSGKSPKSIAAAALARHKKAAAVIFIALFVIILIIVKSNIMFYIYDGPGESSIYPENEYSSEYFFRDVYNFENYDDGIYHGRRGIDVSEHQGDIDWSLVKESGVEFAMIRVGYRGYNSGIISEDEYFEQNIEGAIENGIDVGVYFFSQAVSTDEAIEEAKFVIDKVKKYDLTMPVAFDMEEVTDTDRILDLTTEERTEITDAFCKAVADHGEEALIYGNTKWFETKIDLSKLTNFDLWYAQYEYENSFQYKHVMWQYSCTGTVDGISTDVDLNIEFVKTGE